MKTKIIVITILVALSLILVIQNTEIVEVKLFFWTISMSRIIMISFLMLVGFFLGLLVAVSFNKKPKNKHDSYSKPGKAGKTS